MSEPLENIRALAFALRSEHGITTDDLRGGSASALVKDGFIIRDHEQEEWDMIPYPYTTPIFIENGERVCYTPSRVVLTRDEVQIWSASRRKVAEKIADLFGCKGTISEIVASKLWKLGPASIPIGRRTGRTVYFLGSAVKTDLDAIAALPKTGSDFIVIIGYVYTLEFDERLTKLAFSMENVLSISDDGEWTVNRDALDIHFGTPQKPKVDKNKEERERKARVIAAFFKNECFYYLHRWEELLKRREALQVQENIAKFTGLTPSDVSNILGKDATHENLFPLADFWRRTFLTQDAYRNFEEWVEGDEKKKKRQKPESLKEDIVRYTVEHRKSKKD